jgi:hypothetical protein
MAQSSRSKNYFLNVEFVSLVAEFILRQFHAEKLFLLSFLIFKKKFNTLLRISAYIMLGKLLRIFSLN